MIRLDDISNLAGKRVLLRVDFNVPISHGKVTSDARLQAVVPTIEKLLNQGCIIILMSHLGRPKEGEFDPDYSLRLVGDYVSDLLRKPIQFVSQYLDGFVQTEQIALLENVRFNDGEKANDATLGKKLANLADLVVMDAFAVSHRAHASTHAVIQYAQKACAGPLLCEELAALECLLVTPKAPVVAIVGGAKVSTKLPILEFLQDKIDHLIVGGGIANTFLLADGHSVGASLCEPDLVGVARLIAEKIDLLPLVDVVVANEFSVDAAASVKSIDQVGASELILDAGPQTTAHYGRTIASAGTVLMNGPLGVFEFNQFAAGTTAVLDAIEASSGYSIAGGGDTVAAIEKCGNRNGLNYVSTAGGAFLEYLEGKQLPAIAALVAYGT